ncbi:hypothetical protein ACFL1N_07155 [Thermodesulfobacteriota bacterium]
MDYIILWIVCLAMSLLFIAAVSSLSARHKSIILAEVWPRLAFWLLFLINLCPVIIAIFLMKHDIKPSWLFPYTLSLMVCYAAGGRFILYKGLKKTGDRFNAHKWPRAFLSIFFCIALFALIIPFHIMKLNTVGDRDRILTRTTGDAIYTLPAKVPGDLDAGRYYDKAYKLFEEKDTPDWFRFCTSHEFNPDSEEVTEFLKDNQGVLNLVKQAVSRPAINIDVDPAGLISSPIPQFSKYRAVAGLLSLSAKVKALKEGPEAALGDLETMEKLSAHLYEMKTLISQMMAIAIDGMRKAALEYVLSREPFTEKTEIARPIKTAFSIMPYFKDSVQLEYISMRQTIASFNYRDIIDYHPIKQNTFMARLAYLLYNVFLYPYDFQSLKKYEARVKDAFENPFHDTIKAMDDLEKSFFEDQDAGFITKIMVPDFSAYYIRVGRMTAGRSQMELALAAASYKAENGKYPDSLEVLVPDYIESVPEDPFDGKPMKLKVVDGGLDIYSVGEDENLRYYRGEIHFYLGPGPFNEYRYKPAMETAKKYGRY